MVGQEPVKVEKLPRPYGTNILVKREDPEAESRESGIIIPHQYRKLSNLGDVVALGSYSRVTKKGVKVPFDVKIGDQILFKWHSATNILEFENNQYLLMKEDDIIVVIGNG